MSSRTHAYEFACMVCNRSPARTHYDARLACGGCKYMFSRVCDQCISPPLGTICYNCSPKNTRESRDTCVAHGISCYSD